jgi:hypothetical protein
VSYQAGGHWHLEWTCDTNTSTQSCTWDVSVRASSVQGLNATPANGVVALDGASWRMRTLTGSTLDGAYFDAPPGTTITLSATLNGAPTPALVFYVNSGAATTAPTDPVEFVPTSP